MSIGNKRVGVGRGEGGDKKEGEMEIKKRTLVLSAILMLVLLCNAAMAIPMPPHQFYGNVTIDGKPAPDGTVISARINGVEYINTTTSKGTYGMDRFIAIPSDDLDTPETEGGVEGDIIKFYVNGIEAANVSFSSGSTSKLDLNIGEAAIGLERVWMLFAIIIAVLAIAVMLAVYLSKRKK